jgi:hypothetical protein
MRWAYSRYTVLLSFYSGAVLTGDGEALGPFDDIVVRSSRVVGGQLGSGRVVAFRGSDGRWLEAEREALRGVASDAPYTRHSHLRLHSPEHDLMLRFFAEDKDDAQTAASEIGPYFAVTIGPLELRADGELVADRASPSVAWVARDSVDPRRHTTAGAVLAVRSGAKARLGEDARVAKKEAKPLAPAPPPTPEPFRFVERVRVDPKIYRARGTAAERDP